MSGALESLRHELVARERERITAFTWAEAVAQPLDVYRHVIARA